MPSLQAAQHSRTAATGRFSVLTRLGPAQNSLLAGFLRRRDLGCGRRLPRGQNLKVIPPLMSHWFEYCASPTR
jgi:hypothetical protein